jgi:unsaturated chondroitin disaccharide hydrolase
MNGHTEADKKWLDLIWPKVCAKMEAQLTRIGTEIPYSFVNNKRVDKTGEGVYWWTNGFWPGMLWLMYSDTKNEKYRSIAEKINEKFDAALAGYEGLHHDLGFMWTLTAKLDYLLTGNKQSRVRALHAANLLAGRYNPKGHFIRAWNMDRTGWIIIDCMMNLPLLYWASKEIDDPRYKYIAIEHADTALKYLVRPDGSCNHIGILDPHTGELLETPAGQGYASGSSWSRGQSWALYGFALSYIHTGYHKYLDASLRIAHYVLSCLEKTSYIPPVDYRSPTEPKKLDTSAGSIAAAGLFALAGLEKNPEQEYCLEGAMNILKALEAGHADWDPGTDFILKNGSAQYHGKTEELHVPLVYGDYYFLECLYRMRHAEPEVW